MGGLHSGFDEVERVGQGLPQQTAANTARQQNHAVRLSFDSRPLYVLPLQSLYNNFLILTKIKLSK